MNKLQDHSCDVITVVVTEHEVVTLMVITSSHK